MENPNLTQPSSPTGSLPDESEGQEPGQAQSDRPLNNKQRAFVEAYLVCWNASQAAREVGYNGRSNTIGPRMLSNVGIQNLIQQRLREKAMQADEAIYRLTEQGQFNPMEFYDDNGDPNWTEIRRRGHLIKSIKPTKYGYEIQFHDAQAAIQLIGQWHGLWRSKHEFSGPEGGPIESVIVYLPDNGRPRTKQDDKSDPTATG
jgi:hypothetical protein